MKHLLMIIDDHPIIHDGLKVLLSHENDMEIVEGALSSSEAMEQLKIKMPDLALIDLSLGDADGTYLIQRIKTQYPKLRLLVYSMSEERLFAERCASAGAHGYVMKTESSDTLKRAIRLILKGEAFFASDILERLDQSKIGKAAGCSSVVDNLSNREMDVFHLVGKGLDSLEISEKLKISKNTVDTHRINIKNKLGLPNGKALDRMAYETLQQGQIAKNK